MELGFYEKIMSSIPSSWGVVQAELLVRVRVQAALLQVTPTLDSKSDRK